MDSEVGLGGYWRYMKALEINKAQILDMTSWKCVFSCSRRGSELCHRATVPAVLQHRSREALWGYRHRWTQCREQMADASHAMRANGSAKEACEADDAGWSEGYSEGYLSDVEPKASDANNAQKTTTERIGREPELGNDVSHFNSSKTGYISPFHLIAHASTRTLPSCLNDPYISTGRPLLVQSHVLINTITSHFRSPYHISEPVIAHPMATSQRSLILPMPSSPIHLPLSLLVALPSRRAQRHRIRWQCGRRHAPIPSLRGSRSTLGADIATVRRRLGIVPFVRGAQAAGLWRGDAVLVGCGCGDGRDEMSLRICGRIK